MKLKLRTTRCSKFYGGMLRQELSAYGSYLLATETVFKSTYIDDYLDSVENEEQGVELYHQLKALWEKAGIHARKWVSNSERVLAAKPLEDCTSGVKIKDSKNAITTTIGLLCNSIEDMFAV